MTLPASGMPEVLLVHTVWTTDCMPSGSTDPIHVIQCWLVHADLNHISIIVYLMMPSREIGYNNFEVTCAYEMFAAIMTTSLQFTWAPYWWQSTWSTWNCAKLCIMVSVQGIWLGSLILLALTCSILILWLTVSHPARPHWVKLVLWVLHIQCEQDNSLVSMDRIMTIPMNLESNYLHHGAVRQLSVKAAFKTMTKQIHHNKTTSVCYIHWSKPVSRTEVHTLTILRPTQYKGQPA